MSDVRLLNNLWDATKKYMLHKNDTSYIKCDDPRMDVRMIYRQDVLNALAALDAVPAATPAVESMEQLIEAAIGDPPAAGAEEPKPVASRPIDFQSALEWAKVEFKGSPIWNRLVGTPWENDAPVKAARLMCEANARLTAELAKTENKRLENHLRNVELEKQLAEAKRELAEVVARTNNLMEMSGRLQAERDAARAELNSTTADADAYHDLWKRTEAERDAARAELAAANKHITYLAANLASGRP